jgi:hypothetical protein
LGVGTETATVDSASATVTPIEYEQLKHRIRGVVRDVVPPGSMVLVVSKGDDDLVRLDGRRARHFPQDEEGKYAGFHPPDSAEAIAHLEVLHERGAEYLVFPSTALWWLDHYVELKEYLETRYPLVVEDENTCLIFRLTDQSIQPGEWYRGDDEFSRSFGDLLGRLLPSEATVALVSLRSGMLVSLLGQDESLLPGPDSGNGATAVNHVMALQDRGTQFIAISKDACKRIMDQYPEFLSYLGADHRLVTRQEYHGEVYELLPTESKAAIAPDTSAWKRFLHRTGARRPTDGMPNV